MDPSPAVETIFHAARALPPAERPAYLVEACGDDEALRAAVEALLRADERAGDFLVGRRQQGTPPAPPGERVGDRLGPYELVAPLGEGGFGTVWQAEQQEPLCRTVALKVVKLGMDTRQVVQRFEQERQALARMDHPHIATVLDAGATATGRPFFVMELVEGLPIVEYCDRHALTVDARLELFVQVCAAVQHAHQKGVVHRDLKPSNVLVAERDGRPFAKVIDFGIAKAISQSPAERTQLTAAAQVLGTMLYMSPEQAEGSPDVDTRADVYSLGVLLYELLVGEPPFPRDELERAGLAEVQRILREVEPKKPSTRISESHDTIAGVAAQRRTEPRRLGAVVRGDLDWIVMKALEKDRARRYETANGLLVDIQRHLAGEPVTAAPPSAGYRLQKLVRRHRVAVTAGALVFAALVLGVAGTGYGLVRAYDEIERADLEAQNARDAEQLAQAETARAVAAREEEARARRRAETISGFVAAALQSADPEGAGAQDATILQAMASAIADLDAGRFEQERDVEANLRELIAIVLMNNGRLAEAEPQFGRALALFEQVHGGDHPELAQALNNRSKNLAQLGRRDEADRLMLRAVEMARRLFDGDHPDFATMLRHQAQIVESRGDHERAEALYRESLAMCERLHPGPHPDVAIALRGVGLALERWGRAADAEPVFERALAVVEQCFDGDHPQVAGALNDLAHLLWTMRRFGDAEPLYERALAMLDRLYDGDHPDLALVLNNLGLVRRSLGDLVGAEPMFGRALAVCRRLYPDDHGRIRAALTSHGEVLKTLGRAQDAEPLFVEALERTQELYEGDHVEVALALNNLGFALPPARGEPVLRRSVEMYERLGATGAGYAGALGNHAAALEGLGRAAEAEPRHARALEIRRAMHQGDHPDVARALGLLAMCRELLGRGAEAEPMMREAVAMSERVYRSDHPELATVRSNYAMLLVGLGRLADAEPWMTKALEMNRRIFPGDSPAVAHSMHNLGFVRMKLDRLAGAEAMVAEAAAMYGRLFPGDHPTVAKELQTVGFLRLQLERFADAAPPFAAALAMFRRLQPQGMDVPICLNGLARARHAAGDREQARRDFDEALALLRRQPPATASVLARTLWRSATARLDGGDVEGALPELEEAVAIASRVLPADDPHLVEYREALARARQGR